MPPKAKLSPEIEALAKRFEANGLTGPKSVDAAKNAQIAPTLSSLLDRRNSTPLPAKQATLVLQLATLSAGKLDAQAQDHIYEAITDGRLASADQVSAGHAYDKTAFDAACGVGVTVSRDEILAAARRYGSEHSAEIESSKWGAFSKSLAGLRGTPEVRWAAPLDAKSALEQVFTELVGPRDNAEAAKARAKAESKAAKAHTKAPAAADAMLPEANMFEVGWLADVYKKGEPTQVEPRLLEEHVKRTGGKVFTRFPPEPNGFLHIGHSKAVTVNFGFAKAHDGHCYLRYDDTNPEAEEQVYFDSILEIVRWLGFEPYKITYSSDYFDQLYALAVELIKRDKAYMCFCSAADMARNRGVTVVNGKEEYGPRIPCEHRSKPVAQSLAEFERMREGAYEPGEAILRMKQDLENGNPQMWDMVAYRTLKAPHHRTGTKWRIYPTYDFTHCLVDSFEDITHSLCTTEFILSRESYDWLCNALTVYRPQQYEYGRLNIEGTVTSKRKIMKLVREGHVAGWDDPRLYTLVALKRRGVPPGAIVGFMNQLGVTTSHTTISTARLEQAIRQYLETTTPRLMLVLNPLRVVLENLPADHSETFERALHPKEPSLGSVSMPFSNVVYIDQSDFRTENAADYFRLAPGKSVGLLNVPHTITATSFTTDPSTGAVTEVRARYDNDKEFKKPQAYIHWVAEHAASNSPVRIDETRVFKPLFRSANPAAADDFLADINKDSLEVVKGAMVETGFWQVLQSSLAAAKSTAEARTSEGASATREDAPKPNADQLVGNECVRFQGVRTAYFALDKDAQFDAKARSGSLTLNVIVPLKADAGKA